MNPNLRLALSGILAMIPSLIITTLRGVNEDGSLTWTGLFIFASWFAGIWFAIGLVTDKKDQEKERNIQ